ncbi:MAG: hypothetical protein HRF44_12895 [Ignavibacterium sp.]|jgi:hypothetical protein
MKHIWFALLFASTLSKLYSQGNYSVVIVIDDIHWENQNEWIASFHANLFLDGVLQQASSSFYYGWWLKGDEHEDFVLWLTSGYGNSTCGVDNEANQPYYAFVRITLPTGQIVTSGTIEINKVGDPEAADLYPRKEDGTTLTEATVQVDLWTGYTWLPTFQPNIHFMSTGEFLKVRLELTPFFGQRVKPA